MKRFEMKLIVGLLLVFSGLSCSTSHPAYRKTASQDPDGTVTIRSTDGTPVQVPRSEIDRVNNETCPKCDTGFYCNQQTKQCERQD
jgi:hypothetical protein